MSYARPPLAALALPGLVAVAAVALVLLAVLAGYAVLYRRPLPRVRGTLVLDGVRAPVTVLRDRWGVPHVRAESMEDAAFAMGVIHAQDRGWQLELSRRVAAGRLSEFAGGDAVDADRFLRRLGLMRAAAAELEQLDPEPRAMLDAYAAGINAVTQSHLPRPVEMRLLRLRPEPWSPVDSLGHLRVMSLGLSLNLDMELQRQRLVEAIGPQRAAQVEPAYPETNPTIVPSSPSAAAPGSAAIPPPVAPGSGAELVRLYAEAARWLPQGLHTGSNSWVVDGSLTATGRPMLCNDPHLAPSVPSFWYEAHVRAGDDFESAGVTVPGLPFTVIGHNREIAWGFTNSFADVQDLVVEELDPELLRYRTEGGFEHCTVEEERIRVAGGADVVEQVRHTRHGPLLEVGTADASGARRGLALQWTALQPGRSAAAMLGLQRASDWRSFRAAVADFHTPSQNAVYADVDGHIGYILCGLIPVRRGAPSPLPVPGWTGAARWERYLRIDEVPQLVDPDSHVIVTANNRVVGDGYPHHIGREYMNGYRARRVTQLLAGADRLDATYMAAIQVDIVSLPAREVAELLGRARAEDADIEWARERLSEWDGAMAVEAIEPALYSAFMRRLTRGALEPLCGEHWPLAAGEMAHPVLGVCGNLVGRITPELLRRWREDDAAWLAGTATWDEVVGTALVGAVSDLRRAHGRRRARWRWGRLHSIPLNHAMGTSTKLGWLLNAGTVEIGGDTDTVLQTAYPPGEPYHATAWAPSWRQILDVGRWDACTGVHMPGQSGHPGSSHYRDQITPWRRNRQHPLLWSSGAVEAGARAALVLRPAAARAEAVARGNGRRAA